MSSMTAASSTVASLKIRRVSQYYYHCDSAPVRMHCHCSRDTEYCCLLTATTACGTSTVLCLTTTSLSRRHVVNSQVAGGARLSLLTQSLRQRQVPYSVNQSLNLKYKSRNPCVRWIFCQVASFCNIEEELPTEALALPVQLHLEKLVQDCNPLRYRKTCNVHTHTAYEAKHTVMLARRGEGASLEELDHARGNALSRVFRAYRAALSKSDRQWCCR